MPGAYYLTGIWIADKLTAIQITIQKMVNLNWLTFPLHSGKNECLLLRTFFRWYHMSKWAHNIRIWLPDKKKSSNKISNLVNCVLIDCPVQVVTAVQKF